MKMATVVSGVKAGEGCCEVGEADDVLVADNGGMLVGTWGCSVRVV